MGLPVKVVLDSLRPHVARGAQPFDPHGHSPPNAFSKKVQSHIYALAIYFMHYNYVRIHQTLRTSPAMAAGVSKTLWSMDDVVRVSKNGRAAMSDESLSEKSDKELNKLAQGYPSDDIYGQLIRDELNRRNTNRVARYAYISAIAAAISAFGSMGAAIVSLIAVLKK